MLGELLQAGGELQQLVLAYAVGRQNIGDDRLSCGNRSCFVKNYGINLMRSFQSCR